MKFLILLTTLFFFASALFAQNTTEEKGALLEAMKIVEQQSPIVYLKKIPSYKKKPERIIQKITAGKFYAYNSPEGSVVVDPATGETIIKGSPSDSLILTDQEQKILIRSLGQRATWPDHLFENSIAVKSWDEGYKQLAALYHANPSDHAYRYVFSFSRPVFIRNGTVCLISVVAMCGGSCGSIDLSFYRKKGAVWQQWFFISGGDF